MTIEAGDLEPYRNLLRSHRFEARAIEQRPRPLRAGHAEEARIPGYALVATVNRYVFSTTALASVARL